MEKRHTSANSEAATMHYSLLSCSLASHSHHVTHVLYRMLFRILSALDLRNHRKLSDTFVFFVVHKRQRK